MTKRARFDLTLFTDLVRRKARTLGHFLRTNIAIVAAILALVFIFRPVYQYDYLYHDDWIHWSDALSERGCKESRTAERFNSLGRPIAYKILCATFSSIKTAKGTRRARLETVLVSDDDLPLDAGDFRLVDRRIVDVLAQYKDTRPYLRGAIGSMGFKQVGVPYDRAGRIEGRSKFPLSKMFELAIDGVLSHSIVPLRLASMFGLGIAALTLLGTFGYLFGKLYFGANWPAGFATTIIVLLAGFSLNALFLGIIGEYLGRILEEVRHRPITIIETSLDRDARNETASSNGNH